MDDANASVEDGREVLDLRGLKCPLPVLHTRRALLRLSPGRVLVVRCTDPLASLDIPNLLRETGDALLTAERDGRETRFTIRRS
jgi:tRNA 2-thiouridine synthesizing protein A